jgi:hypothetical protein
MLTGLVLVVQVLVVQGASVHAWLATQVQHEKRVYVARGRLYVPRNEKLKRETP